MNLFRSEEHVRNWSGFKSGTEEGIVEMSALLKLLSGNFFTKRLDPDYVSHIKEYRAGWVATLVEIGKTGPFWSLQAP